MKCPDCDEEMTKIQNVPKQLLSFTIPFFRSFEVRFWHWVDEPYCEECNIDHHQDREQEAYYAGQEDGARKAIQELERYG